MNRMLSGLGAAVLASALLAGPASADPVTVNLRIEGSTSTLFNGPITTDAETFSAPSSQGSHTCDYAHNNQNPPGGTPRGTPTTALRDAVLSLALTFDAGWFSSFNDFFITQVGSDVSDNTNFWGLYVNFQTASAGGCSTLVSNGDDVLWAYGPGGPALKLTGPTTATRGAPTTFTVVNGDSGAPVSGAAVNGVTTDSAGHATVTFDQDGTVAVKATHDGDVRSNEVDVAVRDASAPPPQTSSAPSTAPTVAVRDTTRPRASIAGLRSGEVFRRGRGPRLLRGSVEEAGGILMVKLRLERRVGWHCTYFSGRFDRFRGSHCGTARGEWFRIGDAAQWSLLLPSRLPRGRYTLDVNAIDRSYNRDDARRPGGNEVTFVVR